MKSKHYRAIKIGIVLILATTISGFVSEGNYIIPLIAFVVASSIIFLLHRKVEGIRNDERIEKIGGKAARYMLSFLAVGCALASIVLMALAKNEESYHLPAYFFSSITWITLIGYSILFHFFNRKGE